ncbi:MAG TPA: small multi-drug export protein [Actinomycetota bacterium]|nr:small multi-drug export protein [Actinomycetota bacterium]
MDVLQHLPVLRDLPPAVTVALVAMIPVIELRGAVPIGVLLGLSPVEAALPAVVGNLLPIPLLVWFLDPVQTWLSRRFRFFARFFAWLFERTRSRHGGRYERFRDAALVLFVGIPLPGTGAWTGAAAAFVFGIKKGRSLLLITLGVLIAAVVVTGFTAAGEALVERGRR